MLDHLHYSNYYLANNFHLHLDFKHSMNYNSRCILSLNKNTSDYNASEDLNQRTYLILIRPAAQALARVSFQKEPYYHGKDKNSLNSII